MNLSAKKRLAAEILKVGSAELGLTQTQQRR